MRSSLLNRGLCSRRMALQAGSALGLSLGSLLELRDAAATPLARSRARSVVILYLSGGPSQLDMWDLKPQAPSEIRGTFQAIDTNVPGMQICEHLPRTARLADKFAIIRSMSHQESDHLKATYLAITGGPLARPVIQSSGMQRGDRPHVGAVISRELGGAAAMPPFVMVPEFVSPVGVPRPGQHAGFFGPAYDPYLVDSDPNLPDYSPGALAALADVPPQRLQRRRSLLADVVGTQPPRRRCCLSALSGPRARHGLVGRGTAGVRRAVRARRRARPLWPACVWAVDVGGPAAD